MRCSLKTIAHAEQVSVSTVSRALNDDPRISLGRREQIQAAARDLNYEKHIKGRRTVGHTVHLFGMNAASPVSAGFMEGARERASLEGYTTVLEGAQRSPEELKAAIRRAVENDVAGLLVVSPLPIEPAEQKLLADAGVVVVRLDLEPEGGDQYDFVSSDNYDGAKCLVKHLIDCGCSQIAMIGTNKSWRYYSAHWDRLLGYKDALKEAGIRVDERLIIQLGRDRKGLFRTLRDSGASFDAVFCVDHAMMRAFLQDASKESPGAPSQLTLGEFDSPLSGLPLGIRLASQIQYTRMIGSIGEELMLRRARMPEMGGRQVVKTSTYLESSLDATSSGWSPSR